MGTKFSRHVSRFLRDRGGNFAIMTAVAVPVLAGSAGVAIDVSNMMMSRSELQQATDAAALAAATAMVNGTSSADGQTLASNFVSGQMANYLSSSAGLTTNAQVTQTTTSNGTNYSVVVNASYSMPVTGMTHLLGFNTMNISASSSSTSGTAMSPSAQSALSMYLVLDRSGSMADPTDTVNAEQPTTTTTTCTKTKNGQCTQTKTTTSTNYYTKIESLKIAVGNLAAQLQKADPNLQYVRTGADSYNNKADAASPLAWGESAALAYVNKLSASGTTDSSGAFANAYNALVAASENQAHMSKNGQVPTKYIVFMTDGDNNQANADTNTKISCDAARKAGIKVYTIAFMAPANGQALLKYCATTAADYFTPQNASDLFSAFQSIGQQASKQLTLLTK
nr:TadE/TadG family type IV pilus assembly protein [Rhizobium sp. BK376]